MPRRGFIFENQIKKVWNIDVEEGTLAVILQDKERLKMFKEMGYV